MQKFILFLICINVLNTNLHSSYFDNDAQKKFIDHYKKTQESTLFDNFVKNIEKTKELLLKAIKDSDKTEFDNAYKDLVKEIKFMRSANIETSTFIDELSKTTPNSYRKEQGKHLAWQIPATLIGVATTVKVCTLLAKGDLHPDDSVGVGLGILIAFTGVLSINTIDSSKKFIYAKDNEEYFFTKLKALTKDTSLET